MNEFAICWVRGDKYASVTAPARTKLKGKLLRLQEAHPKDVSVHQNRDGSVCASVPVGYIKVSPPRRMTEEQKKAAAERLKAAREKAGDEWPDDWEDEYDETDP